MSCQKWGCKCKLSSLISCNVDVMPKMGLQRQAFQSNFWRGYAAPKIENPNS
jgi:hypothetical protein